jgi:hypothetical protein
LPSSQQGQVTDRFTKATDHLGAVTDNGQKKLEIRLGGIYALDRIARDSERDHGPIMEFLTAYVRENAPWPPKPPKDAQPSKSDQSPREEPPTAQDLLRLPRIAADIQAILTVLGRRTKTYGNGEQQLLDLRDTDLRGAELGGARLQGAILLRARLQWATLSGAQLQDAILFAARLEGADLQRAQLEGAKFLTVEQLSRVKTLYEARLDRHLFEQIQQQYPHLLEKPRD